MAAIKLNKFSGIQPRIPESLLPEHAATIAQNCDFAYGELRNTRGGFLVNTMSNAPKSIYTDDGLTFYTWNADVNAVRSPIAKDTYNRLYYTGDNGFKVAIRTGTRINGGPPGSSYLVGVPRPTVAPTLVVTLPKIDTATQDVAFRFHYESDGVKYQEQAVSPAQITSALPDYKYQITPPAINTKVVEAVNRLSFPSYGVTGTIYKDRETGKAYKWSGGYIETTEEAKGTPESAFPVLRMTVTKKSDKTQLFDVYTDNSTLDGTGGVFSLSLAKDSDTTETYTATLAIGIKEADKETRAYVYTYVNTYGEEGPPSPAALVNTSPMVDVGVTVTKDAIVGYAPIKEIRVYRTPSGSTIADYFYSTSVQVLTEPGTTFSILDNVRGAGLAEALTSDNFYPPDQALVGLMALPNGILCAWKGNELHFSEPYKPWAWPPQYVKPLPNTIVGGIAHGSGAIVTTVANPYMVSGVSSDSMTTTRINVDQAGVSKWSIAVVDGAVMYASNDGLVVLIGATASLVQSQKFFTRDAWRARYGNGLSGMRFSVWDGRLIAFSDTGAFTPFMIRVDEADGTLTDLPNFTASCAFVSILSDQCYYAFGTGIYQFNGGSELPAVWQSRELVMPKPVNFGVFQTVTTGSWTVEFYADGILRHSQIVAQGKNTSRLPAGFKSDRWKVKITGSGRFREMRVAQTGVELAQL